MFNYLVLSNVYLYLITYLNQFKLNIMKKILLNFIISISGLCAFAQTNVALGGSVDAVSSEWTTNVGSNAIDGVINNTSRWLVRFESATNATPLPAFIEITFAGGSSMINAFKTFETTGQSQGLIFKYWDGSAWINVSNLSVTTDSEDEYLTNIATFDAVATSKVRLEIMAHSLSGAEGAYADDGGSGADYIRMFEIEVYSDYVASVKDDLFYSASVYPNPVNTDYVTIKSLAQIEKVDIYNLIGKKVNSSFSGNEVNVSSLDAGMYFMIINNTKTVKLVKE